MVLGDMMELGEEARTLHAELGAFAKTHGVQQLLCLGQQSAAAAEAFGEGAEHFSSHAALIAALRPRLRPGVNCLIKGSRSMTMERIVEGLLEEKH